jgi:4-amino-4-deoxy-L-arabinose transferase-like glycosyltransferase
MNFKFEISVLFYFIVILIVYQLPSKIEPSIRFGIPIQYRCFPEVGLLPAGFILVNLIFYFLLKSHLVERMGVMVISGIAIAIIRFVQAPGIIDPVYFFILCATCAIIIGLYKGLYLDEQLKKIKEYNEATIKLVEYIRDEYKYILGKLFQGWLGLGASLGVSMSILFKGDYNDPHLKFMALKMLLGFIGISIAIGIWGVVPMLNGIVSVHESLFSIGRGNQSSQDKTI